VPRVRVLRCMQRQKGTPALPNHESTCLTSRDRTRGRLLKPDDTSRTRVGLRSNERKFLSPTPLGSVGVLLSIAGGLRPRNLGHLRLQDAILRRIRIRLHLGVVECGAIDPRAGKPPWLRPTIRINHRGRIIHGTLMGHLRSTTTKNHQQRPTSGVPRGSR